MATPDPHAPTDERTLDRSLLSDQVYKYLRKQILDHELTSGARIVESEVARQLRISQAPVRDALRQLSHEGLVIQFARRGTFVAELSEGEARQAYAVRAALESIAASDFITGGDRASLGTLETHLEEMRRAAHHDDLASLVQHDVDFHQTVWEASGNVLLPRIWPLVEGSLRRLTPISNRLYFPDLTAVAETHTPLLEGLRSRDPGVPKLFHDHVLEVWNKFDRANRATPSFRTRSQS